MRRSTASLAIRAFQRGVQYRAKRLPIHNRVDALQKIARLTQLLDTVARFIEQGGTLTLDARPEPPLAINRIDYLMSPGADLVDALGLSATLSR